MTVLSVQFLRKRDQLSFAFFNVSYKTFMSKIIFISKEMPSKLLIDKWDLDFLITS